MMLIPASAAKLQQQLDDGQEGILVKSKKWRETYLSCEDCKDSLKQTPAASYNQPAAAVSHKTCQLQFWANLKKIRLLGGCY